MENAVLTPETLPHRECVIEGAIETLSSICGTPVQASESVGASLPCIVAVVSLVGDMPCSVALGLPHDSAVAVAAKLAGFEIPFESSDMGDAIGEVANMIAGTVKAKLEQRGVSSSISLPSVMRCTSLEMLSYHKLPSHRWGLDSGCGPLWIEAVSAGDAIPTRRPGA